MKDNSDIKSQAGSEKKALSRISDSKSGVSKIKKKIKVNVDEEKMRYDDNQRLLDKILVQNVWENCFKIILDLLKLKKVS